MRYSDPTGHWTFEDNPEDPYLLPAASGIMSARRSTQPYAFSSVERQQLIVRRGRQLQTTESLTSLEKSSTLLDYAASLVAENDVADFMLDASKVIFGWARPKGMYRGRTPQDDTWLGQNVFPDWSGWRAEYNDSATASGGLNNQLYHFLFYAAVAFFDGPGIASVGNLIHERPAWMNNGGGGISTQDLRLGRRGVELGVGLAQFSVPEPSRLPYITPVSPRAVGDWLRVNLGDDH